VKCPTDNNDLVMTERQGIEIDYCPKCRGVWLDRGELDKLIERTASAQAPGTDEPYRRQREERPQYHAPRHEEPRHYKKRKSLLSELFDF
jgi:Zn-finger nucleic acid-binding protein